VTILLPYSPADAAGAELLVNAVFNCSPKHDYVFVRSNLDISTGISTSLIVHVRPFKEHRFVEFQVGSGGGEIW
jgi:hypothetical protein